MLAKALHSKQGNTFLRGGDDTELRVRRFRLIPFQPGSVYPSDARRTLTAQSSRKHRGSTDPEPEPRTCASAIRRLQTASTTWDVG
jgi:hypothetical protein